jgi:hypothetical protein
MSFIVKQSPQRKATPLIYRCQRLFFAACIALGMVATLVLVATNPPFYSLQTGAAALVAIYSTTNIILIQVHLLSGIFALYLLPLGLLAMAWLAMRRSPWWASIGAFVVFIGILPAAAFPSQDAFIYTLARMGSNPLLVTIAQQFNDDGVMKYYNIIFYIGTVAGPTLIGIALWRARVVPIWAAALITFSRLLVFLLFPFLRGLPEVDVQLLSWIPLFVGSIPATLAMWKIPYREE